MKKFKSFLLFWKITEVFWCQTKIVRLKCESRLLRNLNNSEKSDARVSTGGATLNPKGYIGSNFSLNVVAADDSVHARSEISQTRRRHFRRTKIPDLKNEMFVWNFSLWPWHRQRNTHTHTLTHSEPSSFQREEDERRRETALACRRRFDATRQRVPFTTNTEKWNNNNNNTCKQNPESDKDPGQRESERPSNAARWASTPPAGGLAPAPGCVCVSGQRKKQNWKKSAEKSGKN